MRGRIAQGVGLALRSGAAPLLLGARLAGRLRDGAQHAELPKRRGGIGMASKVALDEVFFASELLSATVVSLRDHRRMTRELRDALELFGERGWIEHPERYHRDPPPLEMASIDERRSPWLDYRHLRFESGFEPHAGEPGRERWLGYAANRTAHARLLKHPGRMRPWLVCIPGYRMGHTMVDFAGFRVRWLHRVLGLNVAIPVMPLHGPRRVGRRGGDGFFTGDWIDTIHAQAQAVWDVRRLVGWLRAHGAPAVGAYGVSLGGYTTALVASLESDLDCVIAGIPATDFLRLLRSHMPSFLERAASRAGYSFPTIERILRVISPLAIPPRVAHARRFVFAGLADQLASPDHAHDLWCHWDRPRVAWFHGSHVSFFLEGEVKTLLEEALGASGMLPAPQQLPTR